MLYFLTHITKRQRLAQNYSQFNLLRKTSCNLPWGRVHKNNTSTLFVVCVVLPYQTLANTRRCGIKECLCLMFTLSFFTSKKHLIKPQTSNDEPNWRKTKEDFYLTFHNIIKKKIFHLYDLYICITTSNDLFLRVRVKQAACWWLHYLKSASWGAGSRW